MTEPIRLPVVQPARGGEPPIFEKIAIVGLGLIGGSIALAARETWPASLVIGVDSKDVLEQAMVRHAIDVAADEPYVVAEAQLVILAAPVRQNLELLAALEEHLPGEAIVTDVGSTKRGVVAAAGTLPPRLTFVGGHPMAGAARGGIAYARSDLFRGRPWIFTPHSDRSADAVEKLFAFVSALGATPRSMAAAEHDRLMAALSHLPQLTASALMSVVGPAARADGLALAGRGLVDTTRLASSPAGIWRDIAATNADQIRDALNALITRLQELRDDLERGDAIERIFEEAARWRGEMEKK